MCGFTSVLEGINNPDISFSTVLTGITGARILYSHITSELFTDLRKHTLVLVLACMKPGLTL
jgi:CBS domain containing-hemolysin-like protein